MLTTMLLSILENRVFWLGTPQQGIVLTPWRGGVNMFMLYRCA